MIKDYTETHRLTIVSRAMGTVITKPVLSKEGECISIQKLWHPIIDDWNPIYRDMLEPFNFYKFTCPRLPVDIGKMNEELFNDCPSILRMPIKFAKSNEIRLPKEILGLKEEIIRLLQYERAINPRFEEFFVHLTIDKRLVKSGDTQRYPGFHGDGLQGGKFKVKHTCEHSYIFTSKHSTHIALQPFFVAHINESRFNIFKEFDRQIKKECLYKLRDGHLYLIDPYVVHASPNIPEDTERIFFRLTITPEELLLKANTINPMFEGQKYPEIIEVREFVSDPDVSIPLDFYGIEDIK